MKLKVNRELKDGLYHIAFAVSDFSPDEVKKMQGFGVPLIDILHGTPSGRQGLKLQITQVAPGYRASFPAEEQAKAYEDKVVSQIREAMKSLRERTDEFTSEQEVEV